MSWLAIPRDWLASFGDIVRFVARVVREVLTLRVLRFFGEALRQAGILILSSTLVIWGLIFIIGLQCGIEGAYFNRAVDRKSTRLNSSHANISYAVFCLTKKTHSSSSLI